MAGKYNVHYVSDQTAKEQFQTRITQASEYLNPVIQNKVNLAEVTMEAYSVMFMVESLMEEESRNGQRIDQSLQNLYLKAKCTIDMVDTLTDTHGE
mgnify:CR=1 FL=1